MDLTEAEDIKKRWQEYTEELYKKDLHDPDNHDGVITHLEPDILECEVKWALGSITTNKASGGDEIPVELFQIRKDEAVKQWKQRFYIFLGSKITADGNCDHEIKRCLLLGRKALTNLDSILKSRDITLPRKVCISSVAQSCPTLCNPMNRSTPGLPAHHQLPEFTQTHIH